MKITKAPWLFCLRALWLAAATSASAATTYTVKLSNFAFTPATLSIAQGDSIIFTNTTLTAHTTTSGSSCTANALWNSPLASMAAVTINYASFAPGTYPFFCTPHCSLFGMVGSLTVTNAPLDQPPIVSLTNPPAGFRAVAPANLTLSASAGDPDGSVTNVQFFSGAASLGSVATPPYALVVNGLAAGNYSFTAVANDNLGMTATSAPVNVFIFTNALLTAPRWTNSQFRFTVLGVAGQLYSTESSPDLLTWTPVTSFNAPSNTFDVVDPAADTNARMKAYRVRQDF